MNQITLYEPEDIIKRADELGEKFHRQVKTHQLRTFYSGITQIRQDWKQDPNALTISGKLVMLQPKLAYAAGRQAKIREFVKVINDEIKKVRREVKSLEPSDDQDAELTAKAKTTQKTIIENFFTLIEGIVAYHKYYGGE